MAKKKSKAEPRVATVDEMGVLKRDLNKMMIWIAISVAIAAVVAVGVESYLV